MDKKWWVVIVIILIIVIGYFIYNQSVQQSPRAGFGSTHAKCECPEINLADICDGGEISIKGYSACPDTAALCSEHECSVNFVCRRDGQEPQEYTFSEKCNGVKSVDNDGLGQLS